MADSALKILEDLIAIASVNPAFDAAAPGESGVVQYLEQRCRRRGLTFERQAVLPGRENLIIQLPSAIPGSPTLLFETHTDTVGLGSMDNPLQPTCRDSRIYGRGACDAKGCLAAMMWALERAAEHADALPCNIILCAAVDEEHRFRGVLRFLESGIPVSGAVVGEPTELTIVLAHKGVCRFSVQTLGKAAHSSVPDEGISAVFQMKQVLDLIFDKVEPELRTKSHPLCGAPTIVVGTIQGGTQINIVPEKCEIQVDRRVIPGENSRDVLNQFAADLRHFTSDLQVNFTINELLLDDPLDTPSDSTIVQHAQEVATRMHLSPQLHGVPYGSDASKLQALAGIPSIVFGPGSIAQAHSREEFVPIHEVEQAANFYLKLMHTFGTQKEATNADLGTA